jgi:hypothetical protein
MNSSKKPEEGSLAPSGATVVVHTESLSALCAKARCPLVDQGRAASAPARKFDRPLTN